MGYLKDGVWHEGSADTADDKGEFKRQASSFRNWITEDGAPGPTGRGRFEAASGRYHLYVAWACPWAHRTLLLRKLKQLDDHIGVSIVGPLMLENGWTFSDEPGAIPDTVNGADHLYQVYLKAKPDYTGRVTVPVLWDKRRETIVSNESAEIIRMFNSAFDAITGNRDDYCPASLREDIDAINERVYETVNNGVYRCGFARKQEAYDAAFDDLFATLDWLEEKLDKQRFLLGDRLTEADWRLFPTLVRFDPVYVGHFKCNLRRIVDYPNLSNYMRDLYQRPGIAGTVNLDHTKRHYYGSHESVNPTRIVARGPALDYDAPHDRDRFPERALAA